MLTITAFALLWLAILRYAVYPAARFLDGRGDNPLLLWLLNQFQLSQLTSWAAPELLVYWLFSLLLLPFFCILLTADQTASDRSRGTLRFLHLRATRASIFFGRFLGQMLVLGLLILATAVTTFALAVFRDATLLGDGLRVLPVILVNLLIVLMPYTAAMAMVSITAKSARQATIYAIILWVLATMGVHFLQTQLPAWTFLEWVLPGSQISSLLQMQGWDTLTLAPIPLIQTLILLLAGWSIAGRINL